MYATLKGEKWKVNNRGLTSIKNPPRGEPTTEAPGVWESVGKTLSTRNPGCGYRSLQMPLWLWSLCISVGWTLHLGTLCSLLLWTY